MLILISHQVERILYEDGRSHRTEHGIADAFKVAEGRVADDSGICTKDLEEDRAQGQENQQGPQQRPEMLLKVGAPVEKPVDQDCR